MDKEINILLVDDHPLMRQGLQNAIGVEPGLKVIGEAFDGNEAIEKATLMSPDIILMDIFLPQKDGITASIEILEKNPGARIIVLTSSLEDEMIIKAIQAGVAGYVLKEANPKQLFEAIRCVHGGNPSFSPSVTKRLIHQIKEKGRIKPNMTHLTPREKDILRLVGLGLSNSEIGQEINISQGTVRSHLSGIMKKLQLRNRSQVVLFSVRNGFAILEEGNG